MAGATDSSGWPRATGRTARQNWWHDEFDDHLDTTGKLRAGPAVGRPGDPPPGRPVRARQRPVAAHARDTRGPRPGRRVPGPARPGRGRRASHRRGRGGPRRPGRRRRRPEDRRSVRLVHGRRAHRGGRDRPAAPAAGRDHRRRRPQRAGRHPGSPAAGAAVRRCSASSSPPTPRTPPATWCTCPSPGSGCPTSRTTGRTATPRSASATSRTWPSWPGWSGWPSRTGWPRRVMELETALAAKSWDRVTNRDAEKTYTLMTGAALRQHAQAFDWDAWQAGLGAPAGAFDEVIVRQPSFVAAAAELWAERPLEQWQGWLAVRTASAFAEYLNAGRGRGGLRLLRPHPVRHPAAARAVEARGLAGRGRARRGGRPALRRAALPGRGQGTDGHPGREPGRGLPAEHQRAGLDGPADPRAGAGTSWPGSPRRSATRTAGRTTRRC